MCIRDRPPTAERGPSESAPWRRSSAKSSRPKGFRLRSKQSRQYRNLRGLLRLERKKGEGVPQDLKDQIEDFGSGRTETYKVGRVRKRKAAKSPSGEPRSSRRIRLRSVSTHPIRLRSVARPSSAKAKAKPKAKAKTKARQTKAQIKLAARATIETRKPFRASHST